MSSGLADRVPVRGNGLGIEPSANQLGQGDCGGVSGRRGAEYIRNGVVGGVNRWDGCCGCGWGGGGVRRYWDEGLSFGIADVKGDGVGDDKAHFLEEELLASGHGVRMAEEALGLGL